ncbi:hypothetical protein GCM10022223_53840 [Kineosporia mesophila]|uniref:Uncharacterized protein n=1 Tax=Kineosporia mesophila TaxID=566012 RepID=A0ABP7ACN9_9ACTN
MPAGPAVPVTTIGRPLLVELSQPPIIPMTANPAVMMRISGLSRLLWVQTWEQSTTEQYMGINGG